MYTKRAEELRTLVKGQAENDSILGQQSGAPCVPVAGAGVGSGSTASSRHQANAAFTVTEAIGSFWHLAVEAENHSEMMRSWVLPVEW